MAHTLFIADLHLSETELKKNTLFFQFLEEKAVFADALYILGDFFNVWVGDDAATAFEQSIALALKKLSEKNVPIYLMHGNRDFLLGADFCKSSRCHLITDPSLIDLYQNKILLTHGDAFCTQDKTYIYFRKILRLSWLQKFLLQLPIRLRLAIANDLRHKSQQRNQHLSTQLMDVVEADLLAVMKKFGVKHCIHGHTHRPGFHFSFNDGDIKQRIVLSDWHHDQGNALVVDDKLKMQLIYF